MLFADVSLLDENLTIQEHMYLGTEGERITYISNTPPEEITAYGKIYVDGQDKLFLPGFFNAHSHAAMHLLRGYGENLSLDDWLNTRIFPFEDHLLAEDIYWATMMGAAEMLRFGIVGTTDMYMQGAAMGKAFSDSGIKANFSVGTVCFDDREFKQMPQYQETLGMLKEFHSFDNDRLKVEFSLHAEYTTTSKTAVGMADAAQKNNTAIHVHVSETADEVEGCRQRHQGKSPVQYLADCGLLDMPVSAAHCVHIDDEDIAILKAKEVSVCTCPKNNMKLASGFCPVDKLLASGVNLAIGTDSVASNNNLNMIEEIKTFALIHKGISGDPTLITPKEAIYAATRAGAIAQGRGDCGLLKEGYKADIIAIDLDRIYMQPRHDFLNNLVYASCGSDVVMTMVDGKVLYQDGNYPHLDIEKIVRHTGNSTKRILQQLAEE